MTAIEPFQRHGGTEVAAEVGVEEEVVAMGVRRRRLAATRGVSFITIELVSSSATSKICTSIES